MTLLEKLLAIHATLARADVPHAFGGALALAWCTEQARGTIDIDVNLFASPGDARDLLSALPAEVMWSDADVALIERDGQARLWWGPTPVDVFTNTTPFHEQAATRVRWEDLGGQRLPFLDCDDLAVFKAFFNRTRDWADLEDMAAAGTLDIGAVAGVLVAYLGADDDRLERLRSLGGA
jgi:hypothetical protein